MSDRHLPKDRTLVIAMSDSPAPWKATRIFMGMSAKLRVIPRLQETPGRMKSCCADPCSRRLVAPIDATKPWATPSPICNADRKPRCGNQAARRR
jgi:hypothetical protein